MCLVQEVKTIISLQRSSLPIELQICSVLLRLHRFDAGWGRHLIYITTISCSIVEEVHVSQAADGAEAAYAAVALLVPQLDQFFVRLLLYLLDFSI